MGTILPPARLTQPRSLLPALRADPVLLCSTQEPNTDRRCEFCCCCPQERLCSPARPPACLHSARTPRSWVHCVPRLATATCQLSSSPGMRQGREAARHKAGFFTVLPGRASGPASVAIVGLCLLLPGDGAQLFPHPSK